MRRALAVAAVLVVAAWLPAHAVETRTLTGSADAARLARVSLDAGVGDVEVLASESDTVSWEVVLKPRRGGLFSSSRRGEEEVRDAKLEAEVRGDELRLEIASPSRDQRFEERWTVHLPARLAFALDLGVGDVRVRGLAGGVSIDAGVGDVTVASTAGRITIDVGVGDIDVSAPAQSYGTAEASAGVGSASVNVHGGSSEHGGFLGSSASWRGDGQDHISIEVGVGDATVDLE